MTGDVERASRKTRGAWFTPDHLVDAVVAAVVDADFVTGRASRTIRVLDPACGDGRFLVAAGRAIESAGARAELVGVDVDAATVEGIDPGTGIRAIHADALDHDFGGAVFDLVIGNPPYLSQMAAATTRGGSSDRGGGPYMDAAAEFLALGVDLVDPSGGRLAFVLPQSILAARDAAEVRSRIDSVATMFWSTWTGERDFDAQVVTCAVAFEFWTDAVGTVEPAGNGAASGRVRVGNWSHVVTNEVGVPALPGVLDRIDPSVGTLGHRVRLNANFRDEYYGMVPAVGDHDDGPPLVTSGLIDPGVSLWGRRPVRFAKRRFDAPRIDVAALDDAMVRWATKRLVPKVLIANQTPILEAVCDPDGSWLPGVPVVAAYPLGVGVDAPSDTPGLFDDASTPVDSRDPVDTAWEVAAVLTSPAASMWAWHRGGGSGLGPTSIRVGPAMLADLPWPRGSLDGAVDALRRDDLRACGRLVDTAYGLSSDEHRVGAEWWGAALDRIERRQRATGSARMSS